MRRILGTLLLVGAVGRAVAGWSPEIEQALGRATYVYVQSERKTGEWSKPAEIWFYVEKGLLYVGTRPTSWRVKRASAGRTKARIAVGAVDGPSFEATAAVVKDAAVAARMMAAYAEKYPEGWKKYEDGFRKGFETGERVLVRYTPK